LHPKKKIRTEDSYNKLANFCFYNESDFNHSPVFNNLVIGYLCIATLHGFFGIEKCGSADSPGRIKLF